jgi:hypothetical protein
MHRQAADCHHGRCHYQGFESEAKDRGAIVKGQVRQMRHYECHCYEGNRERRLERVPERIKLLVKPGRPEARIHCQAVAGYDGFRDS